MPSKEVTNAAKAIYESRNGARCKPWSHLPTSHQAPYLDDAEAARKSFLAALQEPNANQEQSGMREIKGGTGYVNHEIYIDPETPWHTWRAMLAASALGEQSE
ncbi:hypothetical protein F9K98_13530 [Brucella anthropi]|uniref:hypothetical protein n=1 Tax=Brucella anthropi TaxID=529 RepID=UPI00124C7BB6|nr:hypothetical protein [Brucella anthropi]KAB2762806.1 hypothetical protein F9K98_13530 [Brucella anthropi]MDH0368023.1 hypothetical protein [Brucella anthropi]